MGSDQICRYITKLNVVGEKKSTHINLFKFLFEFTKCDGWIFRNIVPVLINAI